MTFDHQQNVIAHLKKLLKEKTIVSIGLYNQDTEEVFNITATGGLKDEKGNLKQLLLAFSPSGETHCPCCKNGDPENDEDVEGTL